MCLIVFAWKMSKDRPLLLASNRDEFYARAATPATHWADAPNVYAGRDLTGGGTWLGIANQDDPTHVRFATLTNVRDVANFREDAPTRGTIVKNYLTSDCSPKDYLQKLIADTTPYNGYNLLFGNTHELYWYSNDALNHPLNGKALSPGIYALSNAQLNTPWPKVTRIREHFTQLFHQASSMDAYFEMLADTEMAPTEQLPQTGLTPEWEKRLSAICIDWDIYGTRASTLVQLFANKKATLIEHVRR